MQHTRRTIELNGFVKTKSILSKNSKNSKNVKTDQFQGILSSLNVTSEIYQIRNRKLLLCFHILCLILSFYLILTINWWRNKYSFRIWLLYIHSFICLFISLLLSTLLPWHYSWRLRAHIQLCFTFIYNVLQIFIHYCSKILKTLILNMSRLRY